MMQLNLYSFCVSYTNLIFMFCVLLLQVCFASAQSPSCHYINDETGLPSNEVYSIVQDKRGFIWIGCDAGLFRFNGVKFVGYKSSAQKSLAVTGLTVSKSGRVYCHNFSNQIFYVENDSLHELESWQNRGAAGFARIMADADGQLWAGAKGSLWCYNEKAQQWKRIELSPRNEWSPGFLVASKNGEGIWSYDFDSVIYVSGDVVKTFAVAFQHGDSTALGAYHILSEDSSVWLFSYENGDVYKLSDGVFRKSISSVLAEVLLNRKVTFVKSDAQFLYVGTYTGLVIYDKWNHNAEVIFRQESVSNLLRDVEGNTWITTLKNGLLFIPEMRFRVWNSSNSNLPENKVTDVTSVNGVTLFSMLSGHFGTLTSSPGTLRIYSFDAKSDVRTIFFDSLNKAILFNAKDKLFQLSEGRFSRVLSYVPPVKKIAKAGGSYLVCSSFGTYYYTKLQDNVKPIRLNRNWSRDVCFQSKTNQLFIATNDGLHCGTLIDTSYKLDSVFMPDAQFRALALDDEQNVFALNFRGEVFKLNSNQWKCFTALPTDVMPADMLLGKEKMFVATNKGLWIYQFQNSTWSVLNKTSGIASNDLTSLAIVNERLFMATSRGLQSIPLDYAFDKPLPTVHLNRIVVGSRIFDVEDFIVVRHKQSVSFAPEAVSYSSMAGHQFAYRVANLDTAWMFANADVDAITVSGIPAGNFSIELYAVDYQGRFSSNSIVIKGRVIPPFWQQWWFYLLVGFSGLFSAYIFFMRREQNFRERQRERIERIELVNALERSQQAALKAQMNPHFIFNVLNSIKSYIYGNDKQSAADYLSKFAELVRKILSMSNMPTVSLSDEVESLKLYIELEAMLLEPPFEYEIVIDESVDVNFISIPSLIIQPFVENAFKHGLRHKSGLKMLKIFINYFQDERQLLVKIEDNGVGRKNAAILNESAVKQHQSFATEANTKRVELLNKSNAETVGVKYIDKENGSGTIVLITMNI